MLADQIFAVDRFEGTSAIVLDEANRAIAVPLARLPPELKEGDVLRVPLSNGAPDWGRATIDRAETARRLEEAKRQLDELTKRDPGGDIST